MWCWNFGRWGCSSDFWRGVVDNHRWRVERRVRWWVHGHVDRGWLWERDNWFVNFVSEVLVTAVHLRSERR